MVTVGPMHRGGWRERAKRSFDVVGAIVALVLASPLLLLTAIAIKLDSRGPVLFRQQRVGKDGEPFDLLKFRSMVVGAEDRLHELQELNEASGPLFKMAEDPRVTRVGRVLRRLSIDEIPQFWTVLRGKMSIVGPRPALPTEVHAWSPELHQRLRVKPGITGMWQVSGRSDATFDDYVRLDLYYVDNWSLITDLVIMAKTIPTVLSRKGAA
jgi:exopolysaccharide biosynthesis polyprenyl glycosylphosphotransferase